MLFPWNKNKIDETASTVETNNAPIVVTRDNAFEILTRALDKLGYEYHILRNNPEDDSSEINCINFKSKTWICSVMLAHNDRNAYIIYVPGIIEAPIENLQELNFACMIVNNDMSFATVTPEPIGDNSQYVANAWEIMEFTQPEVLVGKISESLERFTATQKSLSERISSLLSVRGANKPYDFAVDISTRVRRSILVRQAEIIHAPEGRIKEGGREYTDGHVIDASLGEYLESVAGISSDSLESAMVMTEEGAKSIAKSEVARYRMFNDLCVIGENERLAAVGKWSLIRVVLSHNDDIVSPHVATVSLSAVGREMNAMYVKAVATLEGNDPLESGFNLSSLTKPMSIKSMYRISTPSAETSEYKYMSDDAREKLISGNFDEMSEEQRLLMHAFISDTGYALYHGARHFHAGRFSQALPLLLESFNDMKERVANADETGKDSFLRVCFMIGYCYTEMQRFDRAYYYLYFVANTGNVDYDIEFFNCVVNSKDPRAESLIDSAFETFTEYAAKLEEEEEAEETPDAIVKMINFLKRRKVYLLIERRALDEAEEMLTKMLDEPENHSFAIDELAYIKRLR